MNLIRLGTKSNLKGKAGNLNDLYEDFCVAKGFVVPNSVFIDFLKINDIKPEVIRDRDLIKKRILEGILPDEEEIFSLFDDMVVKKVIVRSSASIEDGEAYAYSGQFSSFLNVSRKGLIKAIKKCWSSVFDDNIEIYKKSTNPNDIEMDVLVQEMIYPRVSGIAFSMNPTNGKKEISVEVSKTTCDEIVSGRTIPKIFFGSNCDNTVLSKCESEIVERSLFDLKNRFGKEIEIEFGFQDGTFYLFQVRPITKFHFSILDYIDRENWCCFKNDDWNLFDRTLWIKGATEYKHAMVKNEITEDITLYYKDNERQVRGFAGSEPPLSKETLRDLKEVNLLTFIEENKKVIDKINILSMQISEDIDKDRYEEFVSNFTKLLEQNCIMNSYEYLISSLGQYLYESMDELTLGVFSRWKNSEDSYIRVYDKAFHYICKKKSLKIDSNTLRLYSHVEEIIDLIYGKLTIDDIKERILKRKEKGFVLLNMQNPSYSNVITLDEGIVELVKKKFELIENVAIEENKDAIKGRSTFKNGCTIEGECLLLKGDFSHVKEEVLEDKIIVCKTLSAKNLAYVKNAKALIVDGGGVLCHAAIFSRELSIPCLMSTRVGTRIFKTGYYLHYDVDKEEVYRIQNIISN